MTMTATAKPPVRMVVIVGFVGATLFSAVAGGVVTLFGQTYQADRVEQTTEVDKFVDAANKMDPLVRQFVAEEKGGKLTSGTREAIRSNLQSQRGQLENVLAILPPADKPKATRYMEALARADHGIKTATGPLDSHEFAQAVVDIADQREPLYTALRRHPLPIFG